MKYSFKHSFQDDRIIVSIREISYDGNQSCQIFSLAKRQVLYGLFFLLLQLDINSFMPFIANRVFFPRLLSSNLEATIADSCSNGDLRKLVNLVLFFF